jgi:hypothetical protein
MAVAPELILGAAVDERALHLPEALLCLAVGVIVAAFRRVPRDMASWPLVAAAPLGAAVVGQVAARATGRGPLVPLAVLVVAVAAGLLAAAVDRSGWSSPLTATAMWLLDATIAWFLFLSLADTEGAVAALGLAVPVVATVVLLPRRVPRIALATELAALVTLLVGAFVLGGPRTFSWTGWWLAKLIGVAVAVAGFAIAGLVNARAERSSS